MKKTLSKQEVSRIIGERIRKFRTEQKLTQEELAVAAELNPAYIGKVERGDKCPTIDTLYKIANGLKISLCELTNIEESNKLKLCVVDEYRDEIEEFLDMSIHPRKIMKIIREIVELDNRGIM